MGVGSPRVSLASIAHGLAIGAVIVCTHHDVMPLLSSQQVNNNDCKSVAPGLRE
jgi:hypothetical protein